MKFWFFAIYSFVLGAVIGSFLNVCIYRIPEGMSLLRPCRSFCPACRNSLRIGELTPIFSWLILRGRCARCHVWISPRYPLVELLTAMLFTILWIIFGFPQALGYWALSSLLIVATFIDLETLTIPNLLTCGGLIGGLTLNLFFPSSLGLKSAGIGLLKGVTGAAAGYLLLWATLQFGKWRFGKVQSRWDSPQNFRFLRKGNHVFFECAGEIWKGEDMFVRKSDELVIDADFWILPAGAEGRGMPSSRGILNLKGNSLRSPHGTWLLEDGQEISGSTCAVTIPREAMGWGDVKLLAAIGAFIGAPGILFTVFCASLLGTLIGTYILFFRHRGKGCIPFGPFLAAGTLMWILGGQTLWKLYFSRFDI